MEQNKEKKTNLVLRLIQGALIGLGVKKDFSDLGRHSGGKVFVPNPENAAVYDKMFGVYMDLYPALKDLYDRMNGVY